MIKLLIMDVDGTLTDGKIYMAPSGEAMKAFDVKDGYAIAHLLPQYGIVPAIITGRTSKIVENRAKELGIEELYQGKQDKTETLHHLMQKYRCSKENMAYFGDDIPDLNAMKECGTVGCPADAAEEIKSVSQYICTHHAGSGAAREFIEWLIRKHQS